MIIEKIGRRRGRVEEGFLKVVKNELMDGHIILYRGVDVSKILIIYKTYQNCDVLFAFVLVLLAVG